MVKEKKASGVKKEGTQPQEPQEKIKKSTVVKVAKHFTLIQPIPGPNSELFKIPQDDVGRASSLYIALHKAKVEIRDHIADAEFKLIAALRNSKRTSISMIIAGEPINLQIMHQNAKEKIVIKK